MTDEARLAAWHRNVYESYDEDPYCEGCEEQDAEIERLRTENETLQAALAVKDNHNHFDCTAERAALRLENQRLQALIDAYAKADAEDDINGYGLAYRALLAAATKEDDR